MDEKLSSMWDKLHPQTTCYKRFELEEATSGFARQVFHFKKPFKGAIRLKETVLGDVYYGKFSDGDEIAVLWLEKAVLPTDGDSAWHLHFINNQSVYKHRNILPFLGYCKDDRELMCVYSYMPLGSLRQRLGAHEDAAQSLSWKERLRIALDIATGLCYLHHHNMVHRDVRSSTILLDKEKRARITISPFSGSTQVFEEVEASLSSVVTRSPNAYWDPERHRTYPYRFPSGSDVYSFGVVILEIISGGRPSDSDGENLGAWAQKHFAVDPVLLGTYDEEDMASLTYLALKCIQLRSSDRPDMIEVSQTLNELWEKQKTVETTKNVGFERRSKSIQKVIEYLRIEKTSSSCSPEAISEDQTNEELFEGSLGCRGRAFSLAEIEDVTSNRQRVLGEGGFGVVYYGKLQSGLQVAVKISSPRTSGRSGQGAHEFMNEVSLLLRVHHKNIVSLRGYCNEDNQRILVYDYLSGGTLHQNLTGKGGKTTLSWKDRLQVAIDAATGLEYLHSFCDPKIIHRDVKTDNILLDHTEAGEIVGKVADFGISREYSQEDAHNTHVATDVKGTPGYLDPEYYQTGCLTEKSDVYSFGVVLLEIITGRIPNSRRQEDHRQRNLLEWVRRRMEKKDLRSIVDPAMSGMYNEEAMNMVATLALNCVETSRYTRPDMKTVLQKLRRALDCENAPKTGRRARIWARLGL